MRKKHKLKISKWKNGVLEHHESEHETFQEALIASEAFHGLVKIYNELNQLIHVENRLIGELIKDLKDDCYA